MFRYIFIFLTLNSSYRSLGVPTPTNVPNLLTALVISCEDVFLSDQIKNKSSNCAELSSLHKQKQLECLMFYDINKQLCSAVGDAKLALTEDYSAKINEDVDVNLLCDSTKDWVFQNITEFPHYKQTADKVFKNSRVCGKICGVEDLLSEQANFFCKYFKWGTEMLKTQGATSALENPVQQPSQVGIENKPMNPSSNEVSDVQIKNIHTSTQNMAPESSSVKTEQSGNSPVVKGAPTPNNVQTLELTGVNTASEKTEIKNTKDEPSSAVDIPLTQSLSDLSNLEAQGNPVIEPVGNKLTADEKPEVDSKIQLPNREQSLKDSLPESSKDKAGDVDDYQDPDDGVGDQVDDDGDETVIGEMNKATGQKPEVLQSPEHQKTVVSSYTGESVQGLYPSFGQDYEDDDSDHFFSFFLTAIIMVVLIYVLYHNKNRVGKLFFGLILEGRQSGRRRNSRGHAYRRLDTLEQAMSTNTDAPPSKIIY